MGVRVRSVFHHDFQGEESPSVLSPCVVCTAIISAVDVMYDLLLS